MPKYVEWIGRQTHKLTVIAKLDKVPNSNGHYYLQVQCACGVIKTIHSASWRNIKSCGCAIAEHLARARKPVIDMSGTKNGRLLLLSRATPVKGSRQGSKYFAVCDCGNFTTIRKQQLWGPNSTKSCGCLQREFVSRTGSKSASWKPEKPDSERVERRLLPGYYEWGNLIKKSANYTCSKCLQRGGRLVAHHLRNYAQWPELRLEPSNGVCLCQSCHRQFHSRFGIRNNDEVQMTQFLQKEQ